MSDDRPYNPQIAIAELLSRTEAAHGLYEKEVLGGKYDDDWPIWYARHLREIGVVDHIPEGPGREIVHERLESLLSSADEAFRAEESDSRWPSFYAMYLLRVAKEHEVNG